MGRIPTTWYPSKKLFAFKFLVLTCFLYLYFHEKPGESQASPTQYLSYRSNPLFDVISKNGTSSPTDPSTTGEQYPLPPLDNIPKNPTEPKQPIPSQPTEPQKPTQPEQPHKPEQPAEPQQPTEPKQPTKPKQPIEPQPEPGPHREYIPLIQESKMLKPRQKVESLKKDKAVNRDGPSAFLDNGGVIDNKNPREIFLCRLHVNRRCYSKYIAEHVELMYAFCPIYEINQGKSPKLYENHKNFLGYMKSVGLSTVVLEAIYPGQRFRATKAGNEPWEIQLQVNDTFYYRENFLNVAVRKTPGCEYILWIDAHQMFLNNYWWEEALFKMEHSASVQFYQTLAHLNQWTNETVPWFDLAGVQYAYKTTKDIRFWIDAAKGMWNGNAVGIRREIYEQIGYIIDECIAGCCNCAFNYANMVDYWDRMDIYPNYGDQLMPWILEARKVMGGNADVVRGRMYHIYHEHSFDWGKHFKEFENKLYNLTTELYRDENFTLHVRDNSSLLEIFPQVA